MLKQLKLLSKNRKILGGQIGIERESLRVDEKGVLSFEKHPEVFGDKIGNPYITTDFSESQVELITPSFSTCKETYDFLSNLYNITALEIKDGEYLWPQSMPCIIPDGMEIPIASYSDSVVGEEARKYREKLIKKYGGKKQLISGIHYNFSFNEDLIDGLYNDSDKSLDYKTFKDNIYLKVTRNFLRYRWLLLYLLGATGMIHESYECECLKKFDRVSEGVLSNNDAMSFRNSECGYKNLTELFPNYTSTEEYVNSIQQFINDGVIDSHKELYSTIRLKGKDNKNLLLSLKDNGIKYLEYRSIDINPFDKCGISITDLNFLQLFNLFLLIEDEADYSNWQEEAYENHNIIAKHGKNNVQLKRNGVTISREEWSMNILNKIQQINEELSIGREDVIEEIIERVKDYKLTYTYRILQKVREEGYIKAHINLAKEFKEDAYANRFRLIGYEDLELSTQILMKESMKRGIEVDVVDRVENFISLKNQDKIEYVMQATKTSQDTYISVLIMENKVVTKKVLEKAGIRVPMGMEFHSVEDAIGEIGKFIKKPIVVKPKSTNFGLGISIFPSGTEQEDIERALGIAFKHDNTVLIEEFIQGKEYRFLVIGDKVVGILHRVPANVIGDGEKTITQLV